jgi:hypothetical protein
MEVRRPGARVRFYGRPKTGSDDSQSARGSNGHFLGSADVLPLVKEDAGGSSRATTFQEVKQADGNCAAGTIAVHARYNNRFAVNAAITLTTSED